MLSSSRSPSEVSRSASADRLARGCRQFVEPAEELDANALRPQLRRLAPDRVLEQAEQPDHLVVGTGPVLAAERVQRQDRHRAPDRVLQQAADRLDAGGVALDLLQAVLAGPSAVAVHDDRHVAG